MTPNPTEFLDALEEIQQRIEHDRPSGWIVAGEKGGMMRYVEDFELGGDDE